MTKQNPPRAAALSRPEILAAAATALFFAATIAFVLSAWIIGAALASLAVAFSSLMALAVLLERGAADAHVRTARADAAHAQALAGALLDLGGASQRQDIPLHAVLTRIAADASRFSGDTDAAVHADPALLEHALAALAARAASRAGGVRFEIARENDAAAIAVVEDKKPDFTAATLARDLDLAAARRFAEAGGFSLSVETERVVVRAPLAR